jgi:hypothetical protein
MVEILNSKLIKRFFLLQETIIAYRRNINIKLYNYNNLYIYIYIYIYIFDTDFSSNFLPHGILTLLLYSLSFSN